MTTRTGGRSSLDVTADLSNLIEEYGICNEGSARRITEVDRQWIKHLVFALVTVELRPLPEKSA